MLGLLYIFIAVCFGSAICFIVVPRLGEVSKLTYRGAEINLNPLFIKIPVWMLTGTIFMTWITYLVAYLYRFGEDPLKPANMISMSTAFAVFAAVQCYRFIKKKNAWDVRDFFGTLKMSEVAFITLVLLLTYNLMWTTLSVSHNQLYVGATVFSDFSPHLGMIRSFSYGNNFPTQYSFFAGEDIRYHFMFQFLVGNLEYLGMRIDFAFNLPSMFGMVSMFSLLYVLAVKIAGRRAVGYLSCFFLAFRSSGSFFTYLAEMPEGKSLWTHLIQNNEFIGYTINENWGLWNLNVYCNQRHFAFSISVMLFVLIKFLPYLYEMTDRLKELTEVKSFWKRAVLFFRASFFLREGWSVKNWGVAIGSGVLLGAIAFWNGAVLIGVLSVLFVLAIVSDHRLEFLITAVIAVALSFLQSYLFIQGEAVSPAFQFGFIAENLTLFGVLDYILRLLGILPCVLLLSFLVAKGVRKYIMFSFLAPFILAFTLSLTTDITVNHKYIMLSVILLNIFAAILIVNAFKNKNYWIRGTCVFLVIGLTVTGIYDTSTLFRKNAPQNNMVYRLDDPLTNWVRENSDSKDIFLTSNYALNPIVLGGAMLFQGWQYFSWSAGYDTSDRDKRVKQMYEADQPTLLDKLVKENRIRFIIIDYDNRISESYALNEAVIAASYQAVFEHGEGNWKTTIYDTEKPIYK